MVDLVTGGKAEGRMVTLATDSTTRKGDQRRYFTSSVNYETSQTILSLGGALACAFIYMILHLDCGIHDC